MKVKFNPYCSAYCSTITNNWTPVRFGVICNLSGNFSSRYNNVTNFQVVVISSVLLLQVVSGLSRTLTQLNFLLVPETSASASLVSLPLHMQLLGALSSTLVLPLLLHWSRIKSLSVCCLLFIVTSILVIFTDISWMFRLSEFLSGFASGLTLPLMHMYSSEVFTPKRRTKFALVITFLHTLGEMIAAVVGYFFTIEVRLIVRSKKQ